MAPSFSSPFSSPSPDTSLPPSSSPAPWLLVLPPEGAARVLALDMAEAMRTVLGAGRVQVFDFRLYLQAFGKMLRQPFLSQGAPLLLEGETYGDLPVDLANQGLVVKALETRARHLLVFALAPVTRFVLGLLRSQGIKTALWFYEDYREARYWREVAEGYDLFCGIQRGGLERELRARGLRFLYLPTGAKPVSPRLEDGLRPAAPRPGGPLSLLFVGIPSPYRIRALEGLLALRPAGLRLVVAGADWENYRGPLEPCLTARKWVDGERLSRLYAEADLVLNLGYRDPLENTLEAEEDGARHLSPRVFEALGRGQALLTEEGPLLRETLPDCVYRTFASIPDLLLKVETLLRQGGLPAPAERARNGRIIAARHSLLARAEALVAAAEGGRLPEG